MVRYRPQVCWAESHLGHLCCRTSPKHRAVGNLPKNIIRHQARGCHLDREETAGPTLRHLQRALHSLSSLGNRVRRSRSLDCSAIRLADQKPFVVHIHYGLVSASRPLIIRSKDRHKMDYAALIEARIKRDAERIAIDIFHRRNASGLVLSELSEEILGIVEREITNFSRPTSRSKVFKKLSG